MQVAPMRRGSIRNPEHNVNERHADHHPDRWHGVSNFKMATRSGGMVATGAPTCGIS